MTLTIFSFVSFTLFAIQINAHMLLNKPMRFPSQLSPSGWNGPLTTTSSGGISNYPCKIGDAPGTYDFDFPRTAIPLGSNYSMQLQGESVHGGGSCQISLTKDLEPTRDSVFKVIHSVIGGCPARDTPGNLGDDTSYTAIDPFEYEFTIPEDLEPGSYTFAWTWFNKIGNREMYMNCAPIEVTVAASGKKKRDSAFFDALPNMFLANIPDVPDCQSSAGFTNMIFPDPGSSVENNNAGDSFAAPIISNNANCYAPPGKAAVASPANPLPASSSTSVSSSAPTTMVTLSSATHNVPTVTSSAPDVTTNAITSAYTAPVTLPTAHQSAPSAIPSIIPGKCDTGSVSCTTPGALVCMDSTHFGICDLNHCAIAQSVAAGTSCSAGNIVKKKRSLRSSGVGESEEILENVNKRSLRSSELDEQQKLLGFMKKRSFRSDRFNEQQKVLGIVKKRSLRSSGLDEKQKLLGNVK